MYIRERRGYAAFATAKLEDMRDYLEENHTELTLNEQREAQRIAKRIGRAITNRSDNGITAGIPIKGGVLGLRHTKHALAVYAEANRQLMQENTSFEVVQSYSPNGFHAGLFYMHGESTKDIALPTSVRGNPAEHVYVMKPVFPPYENYQSH